MTAVDDPADAAFADREERIDGRAKVTGAAAYLADRVPADSLWMATARSPVAHARITSIDVTNALAMPGVEAVLTGADATVIRFGRRLQDWPVLALDRVRFIGDRVAVVAAATPWEAAAAADQVVVDYDELPALLDPALAQAADAPVLHPDLDYTYLGGQRPPVPHPNVQGHQVTARGATDIEAALAAADRVFEHRFTTARQHQGYIEPHGASVRIDDRGVVHVMTTNKAPFSLRNQLASALGLPADQIEVDSGHIGGDFGGKGMSLDECACYLLAQATGRRVSAVMTYADELQAANPRHAAAIRLRTGVDRGGRIVAHAAEFLFDGGAYAAAKPMPALTPPGPLSTLAAYDVPSIRVETTVVYTNTAPAGHMRSPGEVQASFAGESHIDEIARSLRMDPVAFRRLNAAREGSMDVAGRLIRAPRTLELLDALEADRTGTPSASRRAPSSRPSVRRGRGIAVTARHMEGGRMTVRMRLRPDGRIDILTGIPDQGAGAHTMMRRVAATSLGVAADGIAVVRETTAAGTPDLGVSASRVTYVGSQAVAAAAARLRACLLDRAAARLGSPDVGLEGGWFILPDGGRAAAFEALAPSLAEGGVEVEGSFDSDAGADERQDFSFTAFAIEVEVDERTGVVRVVDAQVAVDVGAIINPVAHQGQIDGGFAFGIGSALLEELLFDDGRVTNVHLGDYKLPTIMDVPALRTIHVRAEGGGAFGAKMAGELSVSGVAPAIANAVADATGRRVTSLPLTAERVLATAPERGDGWGSAE